MRDGGVDELGGEVVDEGDGAGEGVEHQFVLFGAVVWRVISRQGKEVVTRADDWVARESHLCFWREDVDGP